MQWVELVAPEKGTQVPPLSVSPYLSLVSRFASLSLHGLICKNGIIQPVLLSPNVDNNQWDHTCENIKNTIKSFSDMDYS